MNRSRLLTAALLVATCLTAHAADRLAEGWANPPESAKPRTWWHWMHGNITAEGITKDLEAMKRVGIGGATLFNASLAPKGPVNFFSPEWIRMVQHAMREADRLGLEMSMHNCEGWSSSGGPWVKPEQGMKMLVWSEVRVSPRSAPLVLPQPPTRLNTYRDIAVVAFPTPAPERIWLGDGEATITVNGQPLDNPQRLWDGDLSTGIDVPRTGPNGAGVVQIEWPSPRTIRQCAVESFPIRFRTVELQQSLDGVQWTTITRFGTPDGAFGGNRPGVQGGQPFDAVHTRFVRILLLDAAGEGGTLHLGELRIDNGARVRDIHTKTFCREAGLPAERDSRTVEADATIDPQSVLNLTGRLQPNGTLDWKPDRGDWTVIRFGWTPVGVNNHPASDAGRGLEVDKLDYAAVKAFYDVAVGTVTRAIGPLTGKTLRHILIDSYETGPQNWTQGFETYFATHAKYPITPWLPALTGRYVGDSVRTERFLWDFRKALGDRWIQVYYAYFKSLCHKDGMLLETEPYGGPFKTVLAAALTDVPMTEFWCGQADASRGALEVAGGAHIGGRNIVGAEAFTGSWDSWEYAPKDIRKLGDSAWAGGVNRFIFHTYAHQPDERLPGMALGPHGLHNQRHNTWFELTTGWNDYITRGQYLLQQGRFVADVLQLQEEGPLEGTAGPGLPAGYAFDPCVAPILMQARVSDGQIVLPSGMRYRLLIMPPSGRVSLATARKIAALVKAGACVYGQRPTETPGLTDAVNADRALRQLAAELWGASPAASGNRSVGNGRVLWGMPLGDALKALGVAPDVQPMGTFRHLLYLHRQRPDADIYFVSNQYPGAAQVDVAFRIVGRGVELWRADTGQIETVAEYRTEKTRTIVPLALEPGGSVFVVFRGKPTVANPVSSISARVTRRASSRRLPLEIIRGVYGIVDDPARRIDVTDTLRAQVLDNGIHVDATNTLFGSDPAPFVVKQLEVTYRLGDQTVTRRIAENGLLSIQPTQMTIRPIAVTQSGGRLMARIEAPGEYTLHRANGRSHTLRVDDMPEPITAAGPWRVRFTPGSDAPAEIVFDRLIDWAQHEQPGIRYYAGTAGYTTTIDVEPSALSSDRRWVLDLGDVSVMARVWVNDKPFGILWKAPFQTDVTEALRPGANTIRIEVTNNWVNGLIGDYRRPADQRRTWVPTQIYNADSPLQPSGLLGPVQLRPAVIRPLD